MAHLFLIHQQRILCLYLLKTKICLHLYIVPLINNYYIISKPFFSSQQVTEASLCPLIQLEGMQVLKEHCRITRQLLVEQSTLSSLMEQESLPKLQLRQYIISRIIIIVIALLQLFQIEIQFFTSLILILVYVLYYKQEHQERNRIGINKG